MSSPSPETTIVLLDVTEAAWECGFEFPMRITSGAMDVLEAPEAVVEAWPSQTTDFRLRAFLQIAHTVAVTAPEGIQEVDVQIPMAAAPEGNPEDVEHNRTFTMRVVELGGEIVVVVMIKGEFDD
jgi:hypothetical protein